MKKNFFIIIASFFIVIALAFLIFNFGSFSLTGLAVYDFENTLETVNETINILDKNGALNVIQESEISIKQMENYGLSTIYVNDALLEAKRIFEQAYYSQILRGEINGSEEEIQNANQLIKIIDWKKLNYNYILPYIEDIKKRRDLAFLLMDQINLEKNQLENSAELMSSGLFSTSSVEPSQETKALLENAQSAFKEERYNDTEIFLEKFRISLEKDITEASVLSGVKDGAKNFFQRYWIQIISFLIIFAFIGYFLYKRFERRILKNRINKMSAEKVTLLNLIKKNQKERYQDNKISELVYNIRMKKYEERLEEINQELPVFEEKLSKLSKSK